MWQEIPDQERAYEHLRAYLANPGMVFLAFLDHAYALRTDWTGYQEVVDTHQQGVTWGPWWNLQEWQPKR